ncbi:MAG: ABC transporter permease [Acidobacteriota bacterium]
MPVWHRLRMMWRNIAGRGRVERELEEELHSYQAMIEDEGGPPVPRAEMELIKEEVRDVRLGTTIQSIGADVRQSLRALRRNPALTLIGTAMLALGIGASVAVFSIFHAALLQPLPGRDLDRIVQIWETRLDRGFNRASFAEANFWDVRERNRVFEEVASHHSGEANLTGDGPAEKVTCDRVSAAYFRTLGITPILGRDFLSAEGEGGENSHVVLLGDRFWKRRYGGDPKFVGKIMRLNDRPYTVVGILPPGALLIDQDTYIPLVHRAGADRGSFEFDVIARLRAGVTPETASGDLKRIATELELSFPTEDKGIGFRMASSATWLASDNTRRSLWVLLSAVGFLLLIACLNIANLLLARGMSRKREIAVRSALGASRARLARLVLTESLLLSAFGTVLGVGLAHLLLRFLHATEIGALPRLREAEVNSWVLAAAALVAILSGLLSGLSPALQAPVRAIAARLREGDRQAGERGQGRLRAALVTSEVALSFLLLIGAGLLIRSFSHLMSVNPGFQTENRLVFALSLPESYWQNGVGKQILDRFFERLSANPNVIAAGAVSHRPVEGGDPGMGIVPRSGRQLTGRDIPWASWRIVTPGYFRAVGIPLLKGRLFEEGDKPVWHEKGQPEAPRRVVIGQSLAKILFPDDDAVGKSAVLWAGQSSGDAEIIGVVGDVHERGLTSPPTLSVFLPGGRNALTGEVVVHTRRNPMALMPAIRSIVAELDPNLPIADVRSFQEVVERSVAPQRFVTLLLVSFGMLALLLAAAGIHGVLAYSMSRRTSEIGLRVALGASANRILSMTIAQGMRPVIAGLAIGAIGAWWLSRYFETLLFGTTPFDLFTYIAVAALLLTAAIVACYVPGRRATRIDPVVALRSE